MDIYVFSKLALFQFGLGELSQLQAFDGYCRLDGSDKPDLIRTPLSALSATNEQNCYDECKTTDGCIAFAYTSNGHDRDPYCSLYRGGPYTRGNGGANSKCYTMHTGNSIGINGIIILVSFV